MDLTRISNINEEDENQIKDINIDKFNDMSNDKTASSLNSNNYINSMNSINNISNNISNNSNNGLNSNSSIINNLNNNGYNSPIFSSLRSDYIYSRSTLRNKQIKIPPLNNDFSTRKDSYQSPHLGSIYPRFVTKDNVLTPDYNYINGNYPLMFGRNLTHNLGVNNFSISGLKII